MNEKSMQPMGKKPHNVILENRNLLTATGIRAILSYDEMTACLDTEYGMLTIGGDGLKVSELSVQTGEVRISGSIEYVQYTVKKERAPSIFKRLVK